MENPAHHKPKRIRDWLAYGITRSFYHGFNFFTGYKAKDPSQKAVVYRLILLESIAGVPGMVAASIRHFRSLRRLERDHGWIHTLLEEAENERMHLLTVMKMFNAGLGTRLLVLGGQFGMLPFFTLMYILNPKMMHRFVGYLEETACHTYTDIIDHVETPGTNLNRSWAHLKAPPIAISYWRMPEDAMWVDVLKQILADESHHRDVNHSFASMQSDDPNPHIKRNIDAAQDLWRDYDARKLWEEIDQKRDASPKHLRRHFPDGAEGAEQDESKTNEKKY